MRARTLAFALLLAGTAGAYAATDDELRTQIVGRWGEDAACSGSILTFNADGTFARGTGSSDAADSQGTYQINSGKLSGKVGDSEMPQVDISFNADQLVLSGDGGATLTKCK